SRCACKSSIRCTWLWVTHCPFRRPVARWLQWKRVAFFDKKPVVQSRRPAYHGGKERLMIELTEQQLQALDSTDATPLHLVNPRTKETFVLLPLDEYHRLKEEEYDDSPWTDEEMELLAWEAGKQAGWEDMDDYDHYPEKK